MNNKAFRIFESVYEITRKRKGKFQRTAISNLYNDDMSKQEVRECVELLVEKGYLEKVEVPDYVTGHAYTAYRPTHFGKQRYTLARIAKRKGAK